MAKEKNSAGEITTVRIPAIGSLLYRGTTASKDQRFVNGFFDVLQNSVTQKTSYYFSKRWGLTQTGATRPPAGNATARGCHSWNGKLYSVYGDKIYSGTTDLGVVLTTTTGKCGIKSTRSGAGTRYLAINDGVKLYLISTTDVVSTITVNFPTPNTRDLEYMDGYLFVLKSSGIHYHCTVDDPVTWDNTKFLTAQMYNSDIDKAGIGLSRIASYLVQFGEKSTQLFYNAANASGSALSNYEQAVNQIGCASTDSIQRSENSVVWVSNLGKGGISVHVMSEATGLKEVATPAIKRLLQAEGSSITNCTSTLLQFGGHTFYQLNLSSADRTLLYDIGTELWVEWTVAGAGTKWPIIDTCVHNGQVICQHATNGWLYVLSPTAYQDDSTNFEVLMRLDRVDFGTNEYKVIKSLDIIGDVQSSTTNVSLQYSDDDYVTTSTARTLDMSRTRPFATNMGMFRRRSFQISYSGNNPFRIEALELKMILAGE